jgi:curved DNA-binding protein CbpA
MDTFIDYYAVLGVDANASASSIKAAFTKLALQYHPDVNKDVDAQERMRILLLAYQTLSDPEERKAYDVRRSEHVLGTSGVRGYVDSTLRSSRKGAARTEVSPSARRDRQRSYAFPDLDETRPVHIDVGDMSYDLAAEEARVLREEGMLRGLAVEVRVLDGAPAATKNNSPHHCHRCHHRWTPAEAGRSPVVDSCPACKASDWAEYLLLRCARCHAVFESEQIRYEVGTYNYGDGRLCPPYELFPLCPYCGASGWCPAENARVHTLREQAARRARLLGAVALSVAVVVIVVLGVVIANLAGLH